MITNSSLPSERYVCRIGLLERLPLRTPYPSIAARIIDIVRRLPHGQTTVIVDRTGAHAAYDMLIEKGLSPIGMTISGGDSINWDGRYVTVPKMRLLTGLLSICYRRELEISKALRDYTEFRHAAPLGMAADAALDLLMRSRPPASRHASQPPKRKGNSSRVPERRCCLPDALPSGWVSRCAAASHVTWNVSRTHDIGTDLGQGNRIGPESVGILSFCENHSGNRSKPLKQLRFLSRQAGVVST